MNEDERKRLFDQMERVIEALNRPKTIVPIFVYIPQSINPDDLQRIGGFITEKLAKAGYNVGDGS